MSDENGEDDEQTVRSHDNSRAAAAIVAVTDRDDAPRPTNVISRNVCLVNIFQHDNNYANQPETTLKLFQCFISVLFHM